MPRTETIVRTLYQFDELSDKAKERARDWYREGRDANDFEYIIADAVRMGEILGIAFRTHTVPLLGGGKRDDPNIWWSLGYCQGDGACFEGTYSYAKRAPARIRAEAPEDTKLHDMADTLYELQRKYRYEISATITQRGNGFYPDMEIGGRYDMTADDCKALGEVFRAFCAWIYNQLRTEDEYQNADAQVDDNIRANEYEFTEAGERA